MPTHRGTPHAPPAQNKSFSFVVTFLGQVSVEEECMLTSGMHAATASSAVQHGLP